MKKFISLSLAIVLALSCVFSAGAISKTEVENKWEYITTDDSAISIAPGANGTEMHFAWMSEFFVENEFYYGLDENLSDAKQAKVKESLTFFSKKECNVRLTDLSPETTYYYRHTKDGVMSDIYSFKTDTLLANRIVCAYNCNDCCACSLWSISRWFYWANLLRSSMLYSHNFRVQSHYCQFLRNYATNNVCNVLLCNDIHVDEWTFNPH